MNNLKAELARRGWTYEQMAILINMPAPTFYRKINKHTEFTITEAFKISNVLGHPVDYLFARGEVDAQNVQ